MERSIKNDTPDSDNDTMEGDEKGTTTMRGRGGAETQEEGGQEVITYRGAFDGKEMNDPDF